MPMSNCFNTGSANFNAADELANDSKTNFDACLDDVINQPDEDTAPSIEPLTETVSGSFELLACYRLYFQ